MATGKKTTAKPAKKKSGTPKKATAKKIVKAAAAKSKSGAKKVKAVAKKAAKPAPKAKPVAKKKAANQVVAKPVQKVKAITKAATKSSPKPVASPVIKLKKGKQQSNKTRYSDNELEEFRQLILEKVEASKKELKYLQDQISRAGDNTADDTDNKYATSMDDGGSSMEREYLNQMASRQRLYLDHLDKALVRIQNKTYGICRVTGKLIDKERLRAVPHATLSMDAKMNQQHPQPAANV